MQDEGVAKGGWRGPAEPDAARRSHAGDRARIRRAPRGVRQLVPVREPDLVLHSRVQYMYTRTVLGLTVTD